MRHRPEAGPFRWDLLAPDRLGSMLPDDGEPAPWFLPELTELAGKVLARSGGGDLVFVGRSLDSLHDLLGAALAESGAAQTVRRLPLSFKRPVVQVARWQVRRPPLTPTQRAAARSALTAAAVTPHALARGRPVTFVDVVHEGRTFTDLFALVREWADECPGTWPVVRRRLRFVGVTWRYPTSPHAYRWQQDVPWTAELPAASVVNVSLDGDVWYYLANTQVKLTDAFVPARWLDPGDGPARDEATRRALAEAVAVVAHGRGVEGRRAIARAVRGEPTLAQAWLRTLVGQLNR